MPLGRSLVVVTIAILCSTPPVLAQNVAVGRVSYREGSVSLQPRGKGEWIKVDPGSTVTVADNVWAVLKPVVESQRREGRPGS